MYLAINKYFTDAKVQNIFAQLHNNTNKQRISESLAFPTCVN